MKLLRFDYGKRERMENNIRNFLVYAWLRKKAQKGIGCLLYTRTTKFLKFVSDKSPEQYAISLGM